MTKDDESVAKREGDFAGMPLRSVNEDDEMMFFARDIFGSQDSLGRGIHQADFEAHLTHAVQSNRWDVARNQVIRIGIDSEGTLDGPLMFDVAEDASGLRLSIDRAEDYFELGTGQDAETPLAGRRGGVHATGSR